MGRQSGNRPLGSAGPGCSGGAGGRKNPCLSVRLSGARDPYQAVHELKARSTRSPGDQTRGRRDRPSADRDKRETCAMSLLTMARRRHAVGRPVVREAFTELMATAFLLIAVVGSGIMAEKLCGGNVGLALLANAIATGGALVA